MQLDKIVVAQLREMLNKAYYEPWHLRYVGKPLAIYLKNTGLCFEELYEKIANEKRIELKESKNSNTFLIYFKNNDKLFINENLTKIHSFSHYTNEGMMMYIEIK